MAGNVNHPPHYNQYPIEVIDMMIAIWGKEKTRDFCIMNAFKYRMRLGHKQNLTEDLAKEKWYLEKAKELSDTNSAPEWAIEEIEKTEKQSHE